MDPIGTAQFCISLITEIYSFVDECASVNKSIQDLRREVDRASVTFSGISSVWKKYRSTVRAQVGSGQQAWKNVDTCLKETQVTLTALKDLVKGMVEISLWNQEIRDIWRKPALVTKLRLRKGEIEEFRKRIEGHNTDILMRLSTVQFDIQMTEKAKQEAKDVAEKKVAAKKERENKKWMAEMMNDAAKKATEDLVKKLREEAAEAARKEKQKAEQKRREDAEKKKREDAAKVLKESKHRRDNLLPIPEPTTKKSKDPKKERVIPEPTASKPKYLKKQPIPEPTTRKPTDLKSVPVPEPTTKIPRDFQTDETVEKWIQTSSKKSVIHQDRSKSPNHPKTSPPKTLAPPLPTTFPSRTLSPKDEHGIEEWLSKSL